jgi:hypothetical protein
MKKLNESQWKKDRTRLKDLIETINACAGFNTSLTSLETAVDVADEAESLLWLWMNELQAAKAELKYDIDQVKRNTVKVG